MRRRNVVARVLGAALAAVTAIGCSVEEQRPSMTGPSEFALSISMVASPDQLPRDGNSQSVVRVLVRNEAARPVVGQRLAVTANVGTVLQAEVVTADDGSASFAFVAPAATDAAGLNSAVLSITPIGGTTRTNFSRTLNIPLTGTTGVTSGTVPTASFTFGRRLPPSSTR
jgi:hypothetical protein